MVSERNAAIDPNDEETTGTTTEPTDDFRTLLQMLDDVDDSEDED